MIIITSCIRYEDQLYRPAITRTNLFDRTHIAASISPMGGGHMERNGVRVWGAPYSIEISINSRVKIDAHIIVHDVKMLDRNTMDVIFSYSQPISADFRATGDGGSVAEISVDDVVFPYTECIIRADISATGNFGTKRDSISIPFEKRYREYRSNNVWEALMGI